MDFIVYSHRHGKNNLETDPEFTKTWLEIQQALSNITDEMILEVHRKKYIESNKSLSKALNQLIKEQLAAFRWKSESYIFKDNRYKNKAWRLDFAKDSISVEVAFNHSGTIAWNLMKPVIASELNHVEKAVQTKIGIIISATNELRDSGGFDSAIGTYEKYVEHLMPLNTQLTVPLVIVGLKKPETFYIETYKISKDKTRGRIKHYDDTELLI
ncbi:BglII/BstYI family type II restriction endonuclease [Bacillus wiedmannii]|uniref:BglII/BstYI family type II restriction endonuclease n=1 Tax=Bacillus wiedmannii TaxID=1890302 RepID=UPI003D254C2C